MESIGSEQAPRGIRRKVDDLGRVVIPAPIRQTLGIEVGDEVDVFADAGRVIVAPAVDRCVFCGAGDEVVVFRGRSVCWSCSAALRALDREHRDERTLPLGL